MYTLSNGGRKSHSTGCLFFSLAKHKCRWNEKWMSEHIKCYPYNICIYTTRSNRIGKWQWCQSIYPYNHTRMARSCQKLCFTINTSSSLDFLSILSFVLSFSLWSWYFSLFCLLCVLFSYYSNLVASFTPVFLTLLLFSAATRRERWTLPTVFKWIITNNNNKINRKEATRKSNWTAPMRQW